MTKVNMLRAKHISCIPQADGSIDIVVPASMVADFKLMVQRGTNTYPSKHVEIMDFADRLMGRDSFSGACMKQELVGYPRYPQKDIVSDHWDIPSEDKYELETNRFGNETKVYPQAVEDNRMFAIDPEFNIAKDIAKAYCKGHPETCNCPYHAG